MKDNDPAKNNKIEKHFFADNPCFVVVVVGGKEIFCFNTYYVVMCKCECHTLKFSNTIFETKKKTYYK
jgi:hypothetical protein